MGFWALLITIGLYIIISIDLFIKKDYAMSFVFFCYGLANLGLCIVSYKNQVG